MPNYRYSTPEYMRRNSTIPRQSACQTEKSCAVTSESAHAFHGMPIAMAYVPWQEWRSIYEVEKGLHCGTIFEELYKPFQGIGGCS